MGIQPAAEATDARERTAVAAVENNRGQECVSDRLPPAWSSPGLGILLVGHGTVETAGVEEFHRLTQLVASQCGGLPVETCFLEKAEPTLAEGVARLVHRGTDNIVVMPLLLFAAGHAKRDIPLSVARAVAGHPGVTARIATPLGCHRQIVALSARRYDEAVAGHRGVPPEQTALLLIGRGSSDQDATDAFRQLACLRGQAISPIRVEACFLAMAEPSLPTALANLANGSYRRVVLQPHLLFRGRLLADLTAQVEAVAAAVPECQWLVAGHLGPAQLVAEATVDRVASVMVRGSESRNWGSGS
jgi:sirohydrochlorin cobaltochelatase